MTSGRHFFIIVRLVVHPQMRDILSEGFQVREIQKDVFLLSIIICKTMQFVWYFLPNSYMKAKQQPSSNSNQSPSASQPLNNSSSTASALSSVGTSRPRQQYEKLDLTREDLEQAGYESNIKMWTQEEDKLLLHYREKKRWDWQCIAKIIPGRNEQMCYNRYKRIQYSSSSQWREKDNRKLLRLIDEHGEDWNEIGKHFTKWKPKHIKQHYLNHLRPGLSRQEWTIEDDLQLISILNESNFDWNEAQKRFPQRSMTQIKNRFKSRLRKLNEKKLREAEAAEAESK